MVLPAAAGNGVTDDSAAIQAAINAAAVSGGTVEIPDGVYAIASPLLWKQGASLRLSPGATILATAPMVAMLSTSALIDERVERVSVSGGVWDGNMLAETAIWLQAFTRTVVESLRTIHCTKAPIRAGNGTFNCYELSIRHLWLERRSATFPISGSAGILVDGVSDSHCDDVFITGYEYGIRGSTYGWTISKVHPWFGESRGQMVACFKIEGDGNVLIACNADFGREGGGSVSEGYGYWFTIGPNRLVGCTMIYAPGGAPANTDVAVRIDNAAEVHAVDCMFQGNPATYLATDYKGSDLSNLHVVSQYTKYVSAPKTPNGNYGRRVFRANKDGAPQTGIASAAITKVTFPAKYEDVGGLFSVANSRWTPPAGKVRLTARVTISAGMVAGSYCRVFIYKNGAVWARDYSVFVDGVNWHSREINADDQANGTDYYEVYVQASGRGTKTVSGSFADTYFLGAVLD